MPFLNDVIKRETEIKQKSMDTIVSETSKIMRLVFKTKNVSIDDLVLHTFVLGRLTAEAFRLRCCAPRTGKDVEKTLGVYSYVSGMLGECGGALQQEIDIKCGKDGEGISQRLVEISINGNKSKEEASRFILDIINRLGKEKNE